MMGKAIFILAGIALFIGGIMGLVLAISEKEMAHRGLFALQGILSIILGCLIIAGPVIGAALSSFSLVPISLSGGFSASLWVLLSGVQKRRNSVITQKKYSFFLP